MFKIITLPVGQLQTNCYLVYNKKSLEAFIVDPGDDAGFIIDKIIQFGLSPKAILATHGHYDHILAALELQLAYNIPFVAQRSDIPIINRMRNTAEYFGTSKVGPPPKVSHCFKLNEQLNLGGSRLKVISTPGHTPGSVCFYLEKEQILLSGDTIFAHGGHGRTDFSGGDAKKMAESIKTILTLPRKVKIYPGHGEMSSIGEEERCFRFL